MSGHFVAFSIAFIALLACVLQVKGETKNVVRDADWLLQTNQLEVSMSGSTRLPDVLILGDSISLGYTPFVRRKLAGVANVWRPKANCGPSEWYFTHLPEWVGTNRWRVVHVNFGIWDNHYLKGDSDGMDLYWGREVTNALPPLAKGAAIRKLGFRIRTPVRQYEDNLRRVLDYLKQRADVVVFALTTPVTEWESDDRCGRICVYNEIAADVCREQRVAVNDLYSVAERNLDKQTDGCHFSKAGYEILAEAVAESIQKACKGSSPAHGESQDSSGR